MLDKKNIKILQILDLNARISLKDLGEIINLSKQATKERITKLEQENYIKSYFPIINYTKLNLNYSRIFLKLNNITKTELENLMTYCNQNSKITWTGVMEGKFDFGIVSLCETITQFNEIVEEIENKFNKIISKKQISFSTKIWHFNHKYLQEKEKNKKYENILIQPEKQIETINELDKQIIKKLHSKTQKTLVDIANELKVSAKVIQYRIKQLKNKDIILGYRADINYSKFNKIDQKINFYFKENNLEQIKEFTKFLINHNKTLYITKALGQTDLECELMIQNQYEVQEFIFEIKEKFPNLLNNYDSIAILEFDKIKYIN